MGYSQLLEALVGEASEAWSETCADSFDEIAAGEKGTYQDCSRWELILRVWATSGPMS